jgi:hypothetical protein
MKIFGEPLTKTDIIALSFISLQVFILILNWNYLPTAELDTPYHLLMGKMFSDYDTVMLWDYYEYAPVGRPHLYPPLEHVLLWFIHDITGADWWNIGRFISLIQYPLPLFTVWFFSRKLFNPLTALASVVSLSVSYDFWFWQVSVAPTALIVALFPLFLYSFYKKKVLISIVLLTSFLYLHLGLPYIVILCTFIFSLFSLYKTREYIKQFAVVTGFSVLFFLPWVIHILLHREWLRYGSHAFFDPLSLLVGINVLTAAFFVIGIVICVKKARVDLKYLLVFSATVGFLAVMLYGWRYTSHSPIINCIVTGIGFETVYVTIAKTYSRKKVAACFLLILIPMGVFSLELVPGMSRAGGLPGQIPQNQPQTPQNQVQIPQNQFPPMQNQMPQNQMLNNKLQQKPKQPQQPGFGELLRNPSLRLVQSPLLEMINSLRTGTRPPRVWQINNPEIDELIDWIINNTSEDEILHVENGMLADYLALFTGRRTDSGMYREVTSTELFQAIQEGKKSGIVIIEAENMRGQLPPGMTVLHQFGNLLLMQGAKSELIPQQVALHLDDFFVLLEHPEPHILDQWMEVITHVAPQRVYIGVRQKDVTAPELERFITELRPLCEVRLSIIVEDSTIDCNTLPDVTAVRLVIPQEKISSAFIESVRHALNPAINLEIGIIGPPITENRKVAESVVEVLPFVDRVVRHVPPTVEFIRAVQKEQSLLGEKFFIQIDTYRGEFEVTAEELYMLLQTSQSITHNSPIVEFKYPPARPGLLDFLKKVYAV